MHHRTVAELMTRSVVRAQRDMPFKEIVQLLADNGVTAVPVVDDLDRPVGVVSEADLLRKSSAQADLSGLTPVPHMEAWERAKAEGARAEELMSAPPCARVRSGPWSRRLASWRCRTSSDCRWWTRRTGCRASSVAVTC